MGIDFLMRQDCLKTSLLYLFDSIVVVKYSSGSVASLVNRYVMFPHYYGHRRLRTNDSSTLIERLAGLHAVGTNFEFHW